MDAVARGLPAGKLSGDRFLIWWVDAPKLRLELGFRVEQAGHYRVRVRFLRDQQMGQIQFDIDGGKLGVAVDLYADVTEPPLLDETATELGVVELSAGEHSLGAEVVGKNVAARGYLLAFDYLQLEAMQ
jgi:hypothetical protein